MHDDKEPQHIFFISDFFQHSIYVPIVAIGRNYNESVAYIRNAFRNMWQKCPWRDYHKSDICSANRTPQSISIGDKIHHLLQFLASYASVCIPVSTWPLASGSQVFEWAIVRWFGSTVLGQRHHSSSSQRSLSSHLFPHVRWGVAAMENITLICMSIISTSSTALRECVLVCICAPLGIN